MTQLIDNGMVTLASSMFDVNSQMQSKRWSKSLKRIINIPTPNAVYQYNSGMGGTDRMNQNINAFRVSITEKNGGGQYLHGCWMQVYKMLGFFDKCEEK